MDCYEPRLQGRATSEALEVHGSPRRRKKEPGSARTPEVPPLRAGALEPAWFKGKLILLSESAQSDSKSVVIATAVKLLRAEVASLAADADFDDSINRRSIACLRSVAGRIPGYTPAQDELFYLADVKESLEAHAKVVNDEWPAFLAKRFDDVTL